MRRFMRITAALAIAASVILPTGRTTPANAQSYADFVIQSAFSGVCHQHPTQPGCASRVVGRNNFYSLYPLGGGAFPATASGPCSFSNGHWTYDCNNIRVRALNLDAGRGPACELTYVSPTQINLVMKNDPLPYGPDPQRYEVGVYSVSLGNFTHIQNFNFDRKLTLPAADYISDGSFCQRGDAYNAATGEYIQYVGGCSAFPRTAGGQTTVVQIYFGGFYSSDQRFDVWVNGAQIVDNGIAYSGGNDGLAVMNIQPPAGWLAGNNTVKITHDGQTSYSETAILVGQP